jgi:hypothetical protein
VQFGGLQVEDALLAVGGGAAAAITSMTMNGGTSLRAEGEISRRATSSIMAVGPGHRPAVASFGRSFHACPRSNHNVIETRVDPAMGRP